MRKARILYKNQHTGMLTQHDDDSFTFRYDDLWLNDKTKPAISLTLPKTQQEYHSEFLFPFFYNMLPEGSNKQVVCKLNRLDLNDYFGLLLTTAKNDTIGAIKVIKTD
ncbi:HipA N-terminal domain-containing protein [Flavobacterium sp. CS20]|jgi:serine/threonine-protein kinase HipA|uniref:HipA N-terminal domain-containing protein n=1 Tax=Flavobacterium sp. CS20 TaxID=2775246 RepID=UPI001B3A446E|nr:HipA N-terminal domain-containing protein [Flavobacterium sp. CS20]QTY26076.1 HipA N-terminal domain-containing protein [Flavobacterium sp. CS20]